MTQTPSLHVGQTPTGNARVVFSGSSMTATTQMFNQFVNDEKEQAQKDEEDVLVKQIHAVQDFLSNTVKQDLKSSGSGVGSKHTAIDNAAQVAKESVTQLYDNAVNQHSICENEIQQIANDYDKYKNSGQMASNVSEYHRIKSNLKKLIKHLNFSIPQVNVSLKSAHKREAIWSKKYSSKTRYSIYGTKRNKSITRRLTDYTRTEPLGLLGKSHIVVHDFVDKTDIILKESDNENEDDDDDKNQSENENKNENKNEFENEDGKEIELTAMEDDNSGIKYSDIDTKNSNINLNLDNSDSNSHSNSNMNSPKYNYNKYNYSNSKVLFENYSIDIGVSVKSRAFLNKHFDVIGNKCDWRLGECGYPKTILNNGLTFKSDLTCLARTGGSFLMLPNTGIYKIVWTIETLYYRRQNGVGICTDYYKEDNNTSKQDWSNSLYHVGWDFGGWKSYYDHVAPNGLLIGWDNIVDNIFYQQCQFVGEPLPECSYKDRVGLIYDSNNHVLLFEKNGQLLNSKLTNIPQNVALYWFAAKKNYQVKFSIVQTNAQTIQIYTE